MLETRGRGNFWQISPGKVNSEEGRKAGRKGIVLTCNGKEKCPHNFLVHVCGPFGSTTPVRTHGERLPHPQSCAYEVARKENPICKVYYRISGPHSRPHRVYARDGARAANPARTSTKSSRLIAAIGQSESFHLA